MITLSIYTTIVVTYGSLIEAQDMEINISGVEGALKHKENLLQWCKSTKLKEFINALSIQQCDILYQCICKMRNIETINSHDDLKLIEKGFEDGGNFSTAEKEQTQRIWQNFHKEMNKVVADAVAESGIEKIRRKNITIKQLDSELQRNQKAGIMTTLFNLIEEKIGLDPRNPKSLLLKIRSKFTPNKDKDDQTIAKKDSTTAEVTGMKAIRSLAGSELLGLVLGYSAMTSLGYLAPVIFPLYALNQVIPEGILPIIGGLKVDSILAEDTAINLTNKTTSMKIKKNYSNYTEKTNNERQQKYSNIPPIVVR